MQPTHTDQRCPSQTGQALVEVLAALVLFAIASAVVASAAASSLQSIRAAGVRGRLAALAAREMARLQIQQELPELATHGTRVETFADGAIHGTITRESTRHGGDALATRDEGGALATLVVTVAAEPPGPRVRLSTRMLLPW